MSILTLQLFGTTALLVGHVYAIARERLTR